MTPFDQFWDAYPRKIAKGAARREFGKAIQLTDLQTMLTAIEAYKTHKPAHVDFCHPATWLHQERWDDEWEGDSRVDASKFRRPSAEEARLYRSSRPYLTQDPQWIPIDWRPDLKVVK